MPSEPVPDKNDADRPFGLVAGQGAEERIDGQVDAGVGRGSIRYRTPFMIETSLSAGAR